MLVFQRRHRLGAAQKMLTLLLAIRPQYLDGDRARDPGIRRLEHDARAASPEHTQYAINAEPAQLVRCLRWGEKRIRFLLIHRASGRKTPNSIKSTRTATRSG